MWLTDMVVCLVRRIRCSTCLAWTSEVAPSWAAASYPVFTNVSRSRNTNTNMETWNNKANELEAGRPVYGAAWPCCTCPSQDASEALPDALELPSNISP
jgi:hypothetical protein